MVKIDWRNDANMIFDEVSKRYVLSPLLVRNALSIDLQSNLNTEESINPSVISKEFLNFISILTYNRIYSVVPNIKDVEVLLANVEELRQPIMELMLLAVQMKLDNSNDETLFNIALDNFVNREISCLGRNLNSTLPLVDKCSFKC